VDLYEALVEMYLTVFEGCAVIPQVPILEDVNGKGWEACPDFLAIDFREGRIQVVEVTKTLDGGAVKELANRKLEAHYRENVEHYVRTKTLAKQLQLPTHWRFFVRAGKEGAVRSAQAYVDFPEAKDRVQITKLEDVFDEIKRVMP
jgi:hypothetical protein